MSANGHDKPGCGYAIQGRPVPMLEVALRALSRNGGATLALPACNGSTCDWVRGVAECLRKGQCRAALLFCEDPELASCVANKVAGIRAAAVQTVPQAARALEQFGANVLVVEMAGRTFFEFKELLRLAGNGTVCPPGVACVLGELDGHAHR
jgi:hypothetical protein